MMRLKFCSCLSRNARNGFICPLRTHAQSHSTETTGIPHSLACRNFSCPALLELHSKIDMPVFNTSSYLAPSRLTALETWRRSIFARPVELMMSFSKPGIGNTRIGRLSTCSLGSTNFLDCKQRSAHMSVTISGGELKCSTEGMSETWWQCGISRNSLHVVEVAVRSEFVRDPSISPSLLIMCSRNIDVFGSC